MALILLPIDWAQGYPLRVISVITTYFLGLGGINASISNVVTAFPESFAPCNCV